MAKFIQTPWSETKHEMLIVVWCRFEKGECVTILPPFPKQAVMGGKIRDLLGCRD
jgi:hypothetical protein